jgi:hypothetical protein
MERDEAGVEVIYSARIGFGACIGRAGSLRGAPETQLNQRSKISPGSRAEY